MCGHQFIRSFCGSVVQLLVWPTLTTSLLLLYFPWRPSSWSPSHPALVGTSGCVHSGHPGTSLCPFSDCVFTCFISFHFGGLHPLDASEEIMDGMYIFWYLLLCPGGLDSKVSAYIVRDLGSIPGSGRSPGEGNENPLQYSCLENPMDGGAW